MSNRFLSFKLCEIISKLHLNNEAFQNNGPVRANLQFSLRKLFYSSLYMQIVHMLCPSVYLPVHQHVLSLQLSKCSEPNFLGLSSSSLIPECPLDIWLSVALILSVLRDSIPAFAFLFIYLLGLRLTHADE